MLGQRGVEYYVEARDGTNVSRFPLAAPRRSLSLILESRELPRPLTPPAVTVAKGTLTWRETPNAHWYRIYRGRTADFLAGPDSYLTYVAQGTTAFKDLEEDFDGQERRGIYYYRLTAMDRHGFESAASPATAVTATVLLGAENAVLSGGVRMSPCPSAGSGAVAGWFANPGDQVLFRDVPASAELRIRFSNGNAAAKRCGLYVAGRRVATLTFPVTPAARAGHYVNGVRVADAPGCTVSGDWNTIALLTVTQQVSGEVALRIDPEDARANKSACCNIDRLEIEPATAPPQNSTTSCLSVPDVARNALALKVVNFAPFGLKASIHISGMGRLRPTAKMVLLTGGNLNLDNTADQSDRIVPVAGQRDGIGLDFVHNFPAYSYTILDSREQP
jgi:hypothetical protein